MWQHHVWVRRAAAGGVISPLARRKAERVHNRDPEVSLLPEHPRGTLARGNNRV